MSRARDQRVLVGLVRKAQDPGIPVAERQAFRAKAEEIHRRLMAKGAPTATGNKPAAPRNVPSETTASPESDPAPPEPDDQARRPARKARAWRPVYGVVACVVGLGLGLFVQSQPGAAMIVFGSTVAIVAASAIWKRIAASGKPKPAPATG